MKKIATPDTIPMVLAIALFSTSCHKAVDYYKEYHQVDYKNCNISRINVQLTDEGAASTVVYTFSYNAAGDPVTVKNTGVGTGNPNTVLKYDDQARLKEMIRPYDNGSFETWTKYVYNNGGQIIRDTQYTFGDYVDSIPVAHPETYGFWVSQFSYDTLGRVITRTDSVFGPGSSQYSTTYNFQYDANGNLVTPGATYDSHLNLLRTNKIWMFLCTNYSLSNGFRATAYNTHDLPLSFPGNYGVMGPIVSLDGKFDVEYLCSVD
ncbi:MAG TPA: hypothetical protein VHD83_05405 [Puia sp.]|nr:hypothetical protein [Puia sp.]